MKFSRYNISAILFSFCAISGLFAATYGLYGGFARSLSFNGGIRITLRLPEQMKKQDLLQKLNKSGYPNTIVRQVDIRLNHWDLEFGPGVRDQIVIQIEKKEKTRQLKIKALTARNELIPQELRQSPNAATEIQDKLLPLLNITTNEVVSSETIAASYGENLTQIAFRILIYTIIAIGLYLTFRFDFPFAIGASMALVHDLLFTLGFIGISRIEPSIPVLAAVLTTLGYSINDTIVIFDRIRENAQDRSQATTAVIIDTSINQTLSRTFVTSLLTLFAVIALLVGGERSLRDFAIVVLFGVLIGTYSSIFIAAPCVRYYERFRKWKKEQ